MIYRDKAIIHRGFYEGYVVTILVKWWPTYLCKFEDEDVWPKLRWIVSWNLTRMREKLKV